VPAEEISELRSSRPTTIFSQQVALEPYIREGTLDQLPIHERAVTLDQLRDFHLFVRRLCKFGLTYSDAQRLVWAQTNMHHLNNCVIKKVIELVVLRTGKSCSWVELVASAPQPPRVFVSHNWGEPFRDFMVAIDIYTQTKSFRGRDALWICTFALDQLCVDYGLTLGACPFLKALEVAEFAVLQLDKVGSSLTRIWCLLELHMITITDKPLTILTPMGPLGSERVASGPVVEAFKQVDCRKSRASFAADRRQILNYIAEKEESNGLKTTSNGQILCPKELHTSGEYKEDEYEDRLMRTHERKFEDLNSRIKTCAQMKLSRSRTVSRTFTRNLTEPYPETPVRLEPQYRGMTLAQIREMTLYIKDESSSWKDKEGRPIPWSSVTIYDFAREVYMTADPTTAKLVSYVEMMDLAPKNPKHPEYLIGVHYGMSFEDFMACVEWHAEARNLPDTTVYWAWFFAFPPADIRTWDFSTGSPTKLVIDLIEGVVLCTMLSEGVLFPLSRANPCDELLDCLGRRLLVDLCCSTGVRATRRPFGNRSYEFGHFDSDIAQSMVNYDVATITGKNDSADKVKERIQTEMQGGLDGFNQEVKLLACGPLVVKACYEGNAEKVKEIMTTSKIDVGSPILRGIQGQTPLMVAASMGHVEIVGFLLDIRADPNEEDVDGETALHYAAAGCQAMCAKFLVSRGALGAKLSFREETPLDIAQHNPAYFLGKKSDEVADFLLHERSFRQELRDGS